jgi:hypothetical protein
MTRRITRFDAASNQLTDNYLAPVPSQFMHMPRAMERAGTTEQSGYSVFGYIRALATDCIAITGGNMDAPV